MGTAWNDKAEKRSFFSHAGVRFSRSHLVVPLRIKQRERQGGDEIPPPLCLFVQIMGTTRNGMERHGTTKGKQTHTARLRDHHHDQ